MRLLKKIFLKKLITWHCIFIDIWDCVYAWPYIKYWKKMCL